MKPCLRRRTDRNLRHHVMTVTTDITLPQRTVLNSTMAYREAGDPGAPTVLFLHGNPTSSYIWRNVIPLVAPIAHCIAPDLIGFGQSGKPDIAYRFADHVRYLDAFLAKAGISSAYFVAQDWGTAWPFIWRRASQSSCVVSLSWSLSGPCPHGMIFMLRDAKPSKSSGRLG